MTTTKALNPKLAHTWALKTLLAEYRRIGGQQSFGIGSSKTLVLSAYRQQVAAQKAAQAAV